MGGEGETERERERMSELARDSVQLFKGLAYQASNKPTSFMFIFRHETKELSGNNLACIIIL